MKLSDYCGPGSTRGPSGLSDLGLGDGPVNRLIKKERSRELGELSPRDLISMQKFQSRSEPEFAPDRQSLDNRVR